MQGQLVSREGGWWGGKREAGRGRGAGGGRRAAASQGTVCRTKRRGVGSLGASPVLLGWLLIWALDVNLAHCAGGLLCLRVEDGRRQGGGGREVGGGTFAAAPPVGARQRQACQPRALEAAPPVAAPFRGRAAAARPSEVLCFWQT